MNTSQMARRFAAEHKLPAKDCINTFEKVFESLVKRLKEGHTVDIGGFGKFSIGERAERPGVNIRTGERIIIPKRKAVKFRPVKELRYLDQQEYGNTRE